MQIPNQSVFLASSVSGTLPASKDAQKPTATPTGQAPGIAHLEKSESSQDRDAQERYDGPNHPHQPPPQNATPNPEPRHDLLDLEAVDPEAPSSLDLRG